MPRIKYTDSQVRKYLAEYFQFLKERFSKFGTFLPTEEELEKIDTEELSDLYSNMMKDCALPGSEKIDDPKYQNYDRITTLINSKLIPESKKEDFQATVKNSSFEECNLFLRGMTFGEAPNISERDGMKNYSDSKAHSIKTFSDSLNMLNARKERTNFFGRKVKNSDEFTAVMDTLEKLNNAPYNDNNEEIINAKKACEAYIATHKNPFSTIGRERLQIIQSLDERLALSMEDVKEVEEAKKTWTHDDISVDPQKVDKYAKMIMLTNDVSLENIMDTSKDPAYANARLQASNLLKDAYLKNDKKELEALKEKCAFAISKNLDSFEGKVILDKDKTIDFENKGKDFFNGMIASLKEEGYSNSNKLQELSEKVTGIDVKSIGDNYGNFLRKESQSTLNRLDSILGNNENLKTKAQNFLLDPDSSIESAQFRLDTGDDRKLKEDVGRMIAYSILRHEAYSANPDINKISNILNNPDGTVEILSSSDFGSAYLSDTEKLSELANMGTDEIYKSAVEQSGSIRTGYFTALSAGKQKAHDEKVEADRQTAEYNEKVEKEITNYKKLSKEQEKANYDYKAANAALEWSKEKLGADNKITNTMKEHVERRKKELDNLKKNKPAKDINGFERDEL